ncbi:MAG: metal-dependent hydrolase [Polyangiaceae bacterium]|nr:metal-dependent hydrolase [Polyangiaceae bacterium]
MDNVTHALAGALVAELSLARRERIAPRSARRARYAVAVSALANNVPDTDVAYDTLLIPGRLGYLLHHRGHTHTIVVGVVLGLLVALAAIGLGRLRRAGLDRRDERLLLVLGALGPVVHLAMDGWNSYGVHPFWPLYDGWLYGDSIFIIEPFFWIFALPPLIALRRARWWRVLLSSLLAVILALPWLVPELVPLSLRLALLVIAAGVTAATIRLARADAHGPIRMLAAVGWAAILVLFATSSRLAERAARQHLAKAEPELAVHDLSITPLPGNPMCFQAIGIGATKDGELVIAHASVAPFPFLVDAGRCPRPFDETTAPLVTPPASNDPRVRPLGEFRAPQLELVELAQRCDVAAALRFMRMPFWLERDGVLVIGDARFDREAGVGFGELELPSRADAGSVVCPSFVPPWTPPRKKLFEAR